MSKQKKRDKLIANAALARFHKSWAMIEKRRRSLLSAWEAKPGTWAKAK